MHYELRVNASPSSWKDKGEQLSLIYNVGSSCGACPRHHRHVYWVQLSEQLGTLGGTNTGSPCLNGKLKSLMISVAPDGEFDAAALAWGGGPGGLPKVIRIAIASDHRDFGYPDYSRAIALRALTDAGAISYVFEKGVAPISGSAEGEVRLSVNPIGKEFTILDASTLQSDLEAVRAGTGQINAGDGIVGVLLSRVLLSGVRHKDDTRNHATVFISVQAGSLLLKSFPASTVLAMSGIVIKPRARIFHGHDWVYASEIRKLFGDPKAGDVISLKDYRDRPLGTAIYNPDSQIVARRISRRKQKLDSDFFQRRIGQAIELRKNAGIDIKLARLVWSESDGLPGVIVDCYGDHLVLQTLTLAMYLNREIIVETLKELLNPESIVLRNDSPMLTAEGLEEEVAMMHGDNPGVFVVNAPTVEGGVKFEIDLLDGQKTGLYLDQLDAHREIAKLAKGKRVLDCFCNQGGFALACAKAGAASVTAVDSSGPAIEAAQRNAELNGVEINTVQHNAFDFLKHCEDEYDLVILDPPSFTKNKKSLNNAMRGYKEIHLRGIKLLDRDGILATYCCSHHASRQMFLDNIVTASVDAKRTLRMLASHGQRLDHPVIPAIPETEYLKGFVLQVMPSR